MKNLGISLKSILKATLIGAISYILPLFLLLKFNLIRLSPLIECFGLFFAFIGMYYSFEEKKGWWINLLSTVFLISTAQLIFYKNFLYNCEVTLNYDFLNILIRVGLCGLLISKTKLDVLKIKELKVKALTAEKEFERAKNYKMNPYIRPFGIIIGFLFVIAPYFMIYRFFIESKVLISDGRFWEILLFVTFFSLFAFGIGILFLLYSIKGGTPNFLLRRMEKRLKNNDKDYLQIFGEDIDRTPR